MNLELLVSCMNQEDMTIVKESGITTDVLVINQCDVNSVQKWVENAQTIRMISTTERGLSRSRNMALAHANGDICLFCDNDEYFYPGYAQIVLETFWRLSDADIILFDFDNLSHHFRGGERQLRYFELLHAISCQIAFRKEMVDKAAIFFNPFMGAGSGNGAQEENKFLMDCYKKGLKIYYVPKKIGRIIDTESTWFKGFDEDFFFQRGGATRRLLGLPLSVLYAIYYTVRKRNLYSHELSQKKAFFSTLKGVLADPIRNQEKSHK